MKILLDESLPRKLRQDFGMEHEVWTVRDKGKTLSKYINIYLRPDYRNSSSSTIFAVFVSKCIISQAIK